MPLIYADLPERYRALLDLAEEIEPGAVGQLQVEQDDVRREPLGGIHARRTVGCLADHLEALGLEHAPRP